MGGRVDEVPRLQNLVLLLLLRRRMPCTQASWICSSRNCRCFEVVSFDGLVGESCVYQDDAGIKREKRKRDDPENFIEKNTKKGNYKTVRCWKDTMNIQPMGTCRWHTVECIVTSRT